MNQSFVILPKSLFDSAGRHWYWEKPISPDTGASIRLTNISEVVVMKHVDNGRYLALDTTEPIWDHFYHVAPLVVIGTRHDTGYNLAPKHMVVPLGWENYFGFVCTPRHQTYQNIKSTGVFTVSYPKPDQIVYASLAAGARNAVTGEKSAMEVLPYEPGHKVDAPILTDAHMVLECEFDRMVDGFGENSLIAGKIVYARVQSSALRISERSATEVISDAPPLVYLHPGAFAVVDSAHSFPFPRFFQK